MNIIQVNVQNKIAKSIDPNAFIVCGNDDYAIKFTFDEEWDAYEAKTARFYFNGNYLDVVFIGDVCPVPVLNNIDGVRVGVFVGDLHTSTSAYIPCEKCILCFGGKVYAPTPDVYAQLMQMINDGMIRGEKGEQGEKGDTGETGADGKSVHFVSFGGYKFPVGFESEFSFDNLEALGLPKSSVKKNDLVITDGGNIFEVTNTNEEMVYSICVADINGKDGTDGVDGKDGKDGTAIYFVENNNEVTPMLQQITTPTNAKIGDYVIDTRWYFYRINRQDAELSFLDLKGNFKGADGQSVVYSTQSWDILSNGTRPADCYISPDTCTPKAKSGDLIITADGILGRVAHIMSVSNYLRCEFIVSLKGADGKDGASIPSITDNSTATTPHLDISFGKTGEIRKAFFEQSLLLGQTHYGDGFMQNSDGWRMLMPSLSQNETMATESLMQAGVAYTNTSWGYYTKGATEQHEVKPRGLYMVFSTGTENLKLCKSDGTVVVSGASQIIIMTAPYNGNEGDVSAFVAMGMQIGKASVINPVPVNSIQVELDKGSYITGNSIYYVNEMVKGNAVS